MIKPRKLKSPKGKKKSIVDVFKLTRPAALELIAATMAGNYEPLREIASGPQENGTWAFNARKLLVWLESGKKGRPPFSVFMRSGGKDIKVPFSRYSTLPLINCPGKGACEKFCYSLKAWRCPGAFMRQLQNSILESDASGREIIAHYFRALRPGKLRLYVDGDFSSRMHVEFFMGLLKERPEIIAYGYSKSWMEFLSVHLSGFQWPGNYVLNLSSGSAHGEGMKMAMKNLPVVRGEFVAMDCAREFITSGAYQGRKKPGFADYRRAMLAALPAGKRGFVCPGKCGSCLPNGGHACGSMEFADVDILIAKH